MRSLFRNWPLKLAALALAFLLWMITRDDVDRDIRESAAVNEPASIRR